MEEAWQTADAMQKDLVRANVALSHHKKTRIEAMAALKEVTVSLK